MQRPKEKFNTFHRTSGRYDFCHPTEVQAQYIFHFRKEAPKLKRGFTVDMDYDPELDSNQYTALEAAREIYDIFDKKYLYCGSKKDLEEVIKYLESCEQQDRIDLAKYKILYATYKMRLYQKQRIDAVWDLRDCFC